MLVCLFKDYDTITIFLHFLFSFPTLPYFPNLYLQIHALFFLLLATVSMYENVHIHT